MDAAQRCAIDDRLSHLEELGEELSGRGFYARVVRPHGKVPFLRVVNPAAPVLSENVVCERDAEGAWRFWWAWAVCIGPVDEVAAAADTVARVLAATDA